jgi:MoxR-like ATPase
MQIQPENLTRAAELLQALRDEVGKAVVGQRQAVEQT